MRLIVITFKKTLAPALCCLLASLFIASNVQAGDVNITKDKGYTTVVHNGELIKLQRIQDIDHRLEGSFTKTSRPCPPFCINPLNVAQGVTTVGELEVIDFMEKKYYRRYGVIVDARTPSWHKRGTIPGSINIPFTVFEKEDTEFEFEEAMDVLGVERRDGVNPVVRLIESFGFLDGDVKTDSWDFSHAKDVLLWCNGPWCGQSPRAIRALLTRGFPANKLYYYRGGMQSWQSLGLTTVVPEAQATR